VSAEDADRGVEIVRRALADDGPLPREVLAQRLQSGGVRTAGQALVHVLMLAALRGIAVRGPMAGGRQAYALVHDWLGPPAPVDRERALAELARRYLAGHGPACDRDLARWSGLPLRDARAGLRAIASDLDERADGLVGLVARPPPRGRRRPPPPRLLGGFEPLLLGWTSRDAVLGSRQDIVTVNGIFRPFALVGGRAAATWALRDGSVALEPFDTLAAEDERELDDDAADVLRFLGLGASGWAG
jgi:hypothetical protein